MSQLTENHAKYFAHELTKRCASDSPEQLAGALADAQVDLNPHQIEAALFAFRSPFLGVPYSPTRLASARPSKRVSSSPNVGRSANGAYCTALNFHVLY